MYHIRGEACYKSPIYLTILPYFVAHSIDSLKKSKENPLYPFLFLKQIFENLSAYRDANYCSVIKCLVELTSFFL